jgi:integrase
MQPSDARTSAREAVDRFIRHLAHLRFASTTRRIRRHFLNEYLQHAEQAIGSIEITVGELMDPARADAWLCDAAAGKTRTRNTLRGPAAAAYSNSMRVRIDSYNAFAEFLGLPARRDSQPPADGDFLTPAEAEHLLHDLAVRRPIHANATTSLRTAAVAALVADTGRTVPELAHLKVSVLQLDGEPHVELEDGPCPLSASTVHILTRWLRARAAIVAELEGSDPGHLWIPTKPGRPRGGREPVKPGLAPAAVRTLHAAHRTLVSQVLGSPLRPGALRDVRPVTLSGTRRAVGAQSWSASPGAHQVPPWQPMIPLALYRLVMCAVYLDKWRPIAGSLPGRRQAGAALSWWAVLPSRPGQRHRTRPSWRPGPAGGRPGRDQDLTGARLQQDPRLLGLVQAAAAPRWASPGHG